MRNYGIDRKKRAEKKIYGTAKFKMWLRSVLPGRNRKFHRENYEYSFREENQFDHFRNGIPDGHFLELHEIVTSDLVFREDMESLKKGIKRLLKVYGGGSRFLPFYSTSLKDTCAKIEKMDPTLTSWYEGLKCGVFEFHGKRLRETIDYYSVSIRNINTSFLSLEFRIHITDEKKRELENLINTNYHDKKGFMIKSLSYKKNGGARESYSHSFYSDDKLKADMIYEWISQVEWEFYEEIRKFIPILLHKSGIMPPRIELYYTDIDYRDNDRFFWDSIGISFFQGQFIDESQKMFFETSLSGRYEHSETDSRLMYIIKDDGIDIGQLKSVKDYAYHHMDDFAKEYFKFLFLRVLTREAGAVVVKYKRRLDRIKLKKDKLRKLLKLRYQFERQMDAFARYAREDIWERSIRTLRYEIYQKSDAMIEMTRSPWLITYKMFADGSQAGANNVNEKMEALRKDFDDKREILQHLSDYKNASKSWGLNLIMLLIAAVTLFFVIFPERATWLADLIKGLFAGG